jgi:spore coat protein U-like protein
MTLSRVVRVVAGAAAMMAATTGAAMANTSTTNLSVSAQVSSTCTIAAGALTFTSYDPVAATQVDGSAALTVSCTKGATATVTLGQGSHAGGGSTDAVPVRRMADSGSNFLAYALFSDTGRSTTWGNTAGTGVSYTSTSSAGSPITVYGRIAASQDVPSGSYSDTVVATVTF